METVINFIMAMLQHLSETDSMFNVDWQDFMQVDIIDNFVDRMKDTYKAAGADINGFFVDLMETGVVPKWKDRYGHRMQQGHGTTCWIPDWL